MPTDAELEEAAREIHKAEGYPSSWETMHDATDRESYRAMARAAYAVFERQRGWKPTHRHKKRGTEYEIITDDATAQCGISIVDDEQLVVYRGHDGRIWVRTREEFDDGRFEMIAPPAPKDSK